MIPRGARLLLLPFPVQMHVTHPPVEGGKKGQVPARLQQLQQIGDGARQAVPEQPTLALLATIERDALRILPHPHQAVPGMEEMGFRSWMTSSFRHHASGVVCNL